MSVRLQELPTLARMEEQQKLRPYVVFALPHDGQGCGFLPHEALTPTRQIVRFHTPPGDFQFSG